MTITIIQSTNRIIIIIIILLLYSVKKSNNKNNNDNNSVQYGPGVTQFKTNREARFRQPVILHDYLFGHISIHKLG